jgi:putative acetyltransferase
MTGTTTVIPAGLLVRPAGAPDGPELWEIRRRALGSLVDRPYSARQVAAWIGRVDVADYRRSIAQRAQVIRVAELDGRPVGYASLKGTAVWAAYVDPTYARQGIGTRLVALIERDALRRGEEALCVSSSLPAAAFYERLGFGVRGRYGATLAIADPVDGSPALVEVPMVGMTKKLRPPRRRASANA